jgi:hypothetical protein
LSPAELETVKLSNSGWFEEIDFPLLMTRTFELFDPSSSPEDEDGADPISWHTFQ